MESRRLESEAQDYNRACKISVIPSLATQAQVVTGTWMGGRDSHLREQMCNKNWDTIPSWCSSPQGKRSHDGRTTTTTTEYSACCTFEVKFGYLIDGGSLNSAISSSFNLWIRFSRTNHLSELLVFELTFHTFRLLIKIIINRAATLLRFGWKVYNNLRNTE